LSIFDLFPFRFDGDEWLPIINKSPITIQQSTTNQQSKILKSTMTKSAFSKHRDEIEKHEMMMGRDRGRLAVAMDLLTDALAMVGQHGVYCQSARHPGRPTMDITMVLEQIGDAKELVQSVIEAERS
jgi:hypothetical protein